MKDARQLLDIARQALDAHRRHLVQAFGWTHLEVDVVQEGEDLVLRGEVALRRMLPAIEHAVSAVLPHEVQLRAQLAPLAPLGWFLSREAHYTLHRGLDRGQPGRGLVTELERDDGPVQVLAREERCALIRGRDGTAGWTETVLVPAEPAPLPSPILPDPTRLTRALRDWLGVPYVLGGRSANGIDCSGLMQRVWWVEGQILLPRHSSDQRALGHSHGMPTAGDLLFVWSDEEAPGHVGTVVEGAAGLAVVHASRSRERVVEDPLTSFLDGTHRHERIAAGTLLNFAQAHAGDVTLPESVLGH